MASLIQWLAYSGARRVDGTPAASGKAYFYVPGTTSLSTSIYGDPDGLVPIAQPVALDASGRAVVYTKAPVTVDVQDSTGIDTQNQTRANTVSAAQVEIENAVATGTDLTTGLQRAGGRTDLDTFLSSLANSLGAPDGKVLVSGAGQNIKDVVGNTTSIYFNVKTTTYGAVGDDSHDDTSAVQLAINAAVNAGGGIVYFPPGTYKLTSALSIASAKVTLLGVNPSLCILKQYTSANNVLTSTAANVICQGLAFQAQSSAQLVTAADQNRFIGCKFVQNAATGITVSTASHVEFISCEFTQSAATGNLFLVNNTSAVVTLVGGLITIPTASSAATFQGGNAVTGTVLLKGVTFNHTAASGSTSLVDTTGGDGLSVIFSGCFFLATGGGSLVLRSAGSSASLYDLGCVFIGTNNSVGTASLVAGTTRMQNSVDTVGSATTYTPDASKAWVHSYTSSGASFQFATPTGAATSSFMLLALRYKNTNAGSITPTFSAGYKTGTIPSVASNSGIALLFFYDAFNNVWVQVGGNASAYAM